MSHLRKDVRRLLTLLRSPRQLLKDRVVLQFFRFACVGVLGVSVNYSIFLGMYWVMHAHYLVASATGFLLATVVAYTLNRRFTFQHEGSYTRYLAAYILLSLVSLGAGLAFLAFQVELLHLMPEIANIFTLGLTTLINFTGSRYVVFR